ncbi:MAG: hypothetical protein ACYC1C_14930 [Chloroflexota bacterium]
MERAEREDPFARRVIVACGRAIVIAVWQIRPCCATLHKQRVKVEVMLVARIAIGCRPGARGTPEEERIGKEVPVILEVTVVWVEGG